MKRWTSSGPQSDQNWGSCPAALIDMYVESEKPADRCSCETVLGKVIATRVSERHPSAGRLTGGPAALRRSGRSPRLCVPCAQAGSALPLIALGTVLHERLSDSVTESD